MKDLAYNVRTKYAGEVKLMIKMIPDPVGMALHRFTEKRALGLNVVKPFNVISLL